MKIYTKSGDDGTTGLLGDIRVPKTSAFMEAIGTVDELNSFLGLAHSAAPAEMKVQIAWQQSRLFDVGSELAQPRESSRNIRSVEKIDAIKLEKEIDDMDSEIIPLRNFVLPGGTELAARLHVCRSVCRRAERTVLRLDTEQPQRAELKIFLNRLSDWLFTAARWANHREGVEDVIWKSNND